MQPPTVSLTLLCRSEVSPNWLTETLSSCLGGINIYTSLIDVEPGHIIIGIQEAPPYANQQFSLQFDNNLAESVDGLLTFLATKTPPNSQQRQAISNLSRAVTHIGKRPNDLIPIASPQNRKKEAEREKPIDHQSDDKAMGRNAPSNTFDPTDSSTLDNGNDPQIDFAIVDTPDRAQWKGNVLEILLSKGKIIVNVSGIGKKTIIFDQNMKNFSRPIEVDIDVLLTHATDGKMTAIGSADFLILILEKLIESWKSGLKKPINKL
ncbi:hypothetical protein [Spongiibacter sp. UBA1325]|uniref:hypothetical protein n=1 Tax=Spongiibacter sp. UBA1325 TaxID=1947543 RepID=UPI00257C2037|nr:hypothetical protein [Spongiibacter sp. UBA1325]